MSSKLPDSFFEGCKGQTKNENGCVEVDDLRAGRHENVSCRENGTGIDAAQRKSECEIMLLTNLEVERIWRFCSYIRWSASLRSCTSSVASSGQIATPMLPVTVKTPPIDTDRLAQRGRDAVNACCRKCTARLVRRQVLCQDHELVSPETRQHIPSPDSAPKILRQMSQQFITYMMTMRVVDELESVQIHHQKRDATLTAT